MFIDKQELLDFTDGGLKIILDYYPDAELWLKQRKHFKVRSSEKTPSASVKRLEDGNYIVSDFGESGNEVHRNAIQICCDEEGLEFKDALEFLAKQYGYVSQKGETLLAQEYEAIEATEANYLGEYTYETKDFTSKELETLGPGVTEDQCKSQNLHSLKQYTIYRNDKKTGKLVGHRFKATEHYPMFQFIFNEGGDEWGKRLEPKSIKKEHRFRYYGDKPKDFVMGLHKVKKLHVKANESDPGDYENMDDYERAEDRKDKKLPEIIICSGDRDALSTEANASTNVVWFNSETAKISYKQMKEFERLAWKIYYLGDIDSTGLKVRHELGMRFLDLHLIHLPMELLHKKDRRGNPCKDVRDFLNHYSSYDLKQLIKVAVPYRMWDKEWRKTGKGDDEKVFPAYKINQLQTYHFLEGNGFYRFRLSNVKTGYIYIQIQDGRVAEVDHIDIKAFVNQFLNQIKAEPELRNAFYKQGRLALGESSLSNLKLKEVDFKNNSFDHQLLFFENAIWKVTKEGIQPYKPGALNVNIWEDEILPQRAKLLDPPFEVFLDEAGHHDIRINDDSCLFLKFLINTSRVHWQEEKKLTAINQKLDPEKAKEERMHLINKIYSIGYLMHQFKDPSKPWAVFAMDNRVSDEGESNGGSGKSLAFKAIRYFMKSVTLDGRNPKLTDNPHLFENVNQFTGLVLVDDANRYLNINEFYTHLTGELTINAKHIKQVTIPFEDVPKFAFTSNYALRDNGGSTLRRILYTVFSDYYHDNGNDDYDGAWSPKDDFGKNLFSDFDQKEWNLFINTMARCVQTFLSYPEKIDPPLGNVILRQQLERMTADFVEWAEIFFAEDNHNTDSYLCKEKAFDDFKKSTPSAMKSRLAKPTQFKKAVIDFCKYKGYEFNPPALINDKSKNRILRKSDGADGISKTREHWYIKAFTNVLPIEDAKESITGPNDLGAAQF